MERERIEYLADDYKKLFKCKPHLLKEMVYSSNRKMVGRETIDINHQHLCVMTAVDRNNNIYIKPVTSGTPTSHDVDRYLADRISSDAILVTDECHSYKYLCRKNRIRHEIIESNAYVSGTFSLSRVNSIHRVKRPVDVLHPRIRAPGAGGGRQAGSRINTGLESSEILA